MARRGKARQGLARHGLEWRGEARLGRWGVASRHTPPHSAGGLVTEFARKEVLHARVCLRGPT
jgi:hypothetical protein